MKIQLKQFYTLSRQEKKEHINELKKIPFKELKEFQKAIVYHWYQDWMLEGWPIPKKNFLSIKEELPQLSETNNQAPAILDEF